MFLSPRSIPVIRDFVLHFTKTFYFKEKKGEMSNIHALALLSFLVLRLGKNQNFRLGMIWV